MLTSEAIAISLSYIRSEFRSINVYSVIRKPLFRLNLSCVRCIKHMIISLYRIAGPYS
mgnify:CR=1 FL=1